MLSKRKTAAILAWVAAIGGALSVISALSFSKQAFTIAGLAAWFLYGCLEALVITGAEILVELVAPRLVRRRLFRVCAVFAVGCASHAFLVSLFALAKLRLHGGDRASYDFYFLTGIVGLVSVLVGEAIRARQVEAEAREEALAARRLAERAAEEGSLKLDEGAAGRFGLSPREREIADLLLAKLSYREIAERLFISLPTVKSHASSIYAKTGTSRRADFVELAKNPTKSPMR